MNVSNNKINIISKYINSEKMIPFSECCEANSSQLISVEQMPFEFSFLDLENISFEQGVISTQKVFKENFREPRFRKISYGNTVIHKKVYENKKVSYVCKNYDNFYVTQDFLVISNQSNLSPLYLSYFLRTDLFFNQLNKLGSLTEKELEEILIYAPEKKQQREIELKIISEFQKYGLE